MEEVKVPVSLLSLKADVEAASGERELQAKRSREEGGPRSPGTGHGLMECSVAMLWPFLQSVRPGQP